MKGKTIGLIAVIVVIAIVAVVAITMFYKPSTQGAVAGQAFAYANDKLNLSNFKEISQDFSFIGKDGVTYKLLAQVPKKISCAETDSGIDSLTAGKISIGSPDFKNINPSGVLDLTDGCIGNTYIEFACGRNVDLSIKSNYNNAIAVSKITKGQAYSNLSGAENDFKGSALAFAVDFGPGLFKKGASIASCEGNALKWTGGWILVNSPISGLTVFINGVSSGVTSGKAFKVMTSLGNQNITISKTGYQNYTSSVKIDGGETEIISPLMKKTR